jgi:hypothetical protein
MANTASNGAQPGRSSLRSVPAPEVPLCPAQPEEDGAREQDGPGTSDETQCAQDREEDANGAASQPGPEAQSDTDGTVDRTVNGSSFKRCTAALWAFDLAVTAAEALRVSHAEYVTVGARPFLAAIVDHRDKLALGLIPVTRPKVHTRRIRVLLPATKPSGHDRGVASDEILRPWARGARRAEATRTLQRSRLTLGPSGSPPLCSG